MYISISYHGSIERLVSCQSHYLHHHRSRPIRGRGGTKWAGPHHRVGRSWRIQTLVFSKWRDVWRCQFPVAGLSKRCDIPGSAQGAVSYWPDRHPPREAASSETPGCSAAFSTRYGLL